MKQEELDNLTKDELFALIKTKQANKALKELMNTIVASFILLAPAVYLHFSKDILVALIIFSVMGLIACLIDYWKVKKTNRMNNASDLLNWYDYLLTKRRKRWNQILSAIPSLAVGYAIGGLLHELTVRDFDNDWDIWVGLLLTIAIILLVIILVSKTKGLLYINEKYVDRLRDLTTTA